MLLFEADCCCRAQGGLRALIACTTHAAFKLGCSKPGERNEQRPVHRVLAYVPCACLLPASMCAVCMRSPWPCCLGTSAWAHLPGHIYRHQSTMQRVRMLRCSRQPRQPAALPSQAGSASLRQAQRLHLLSSHRGKAAPARERSEHGLCLVSDLLVSCCPQMQIQSVARQCKQPRDSYARPLPWRLRRAKHGWRLVLIQTVASCQLSGGAQCPGCMLATA